MRWASAWLALCCGAAVAATDLFKEEMFLKPLPPTHLYAYFQFITISNRSDTFEHSHLVSRALGEVISRFHIEELHLSLTEGQWRHDLWGYPVLDAPPGAELYAWFSDDVQDVDSEWKKLSETLSGLFCASLNFISGFNTVSPQMALSPTGPWPADRNVSSRLRYATLPREIVCTENLTPWKKLLPCESSRGFSTLLNSRFIHNTNYHSVGVHFRSMCSDSDCIKSHYEIKQTISLVYDYNLIGSSDWSLRRLFGQGLAGGCPLATSSRIYVDLTPNDTMPFVLTPPPKKTVVSVRGGSTVKLAVYDISSDPMMVNIAAKHTKPDSLSIPLPPPLHFTRYLDGYGQEFGGIVMEITNNHWSAVNIVLLENAPWWLPIQLSTLRVNGKANSELILSQYFSPGRIRAKPYHMELLMRLPPRSKTIVSIDFEFVFLKWQEYPSDANHGFYIGSAIVTALLSTAKNYTSIPIHGSTIDSVINATQPYYTAVLRTGGAVVSLPTPDFSMPYNVICLACTVVALAFGPLHNICTKRLLLKPIGPATSLLQKILRIIKKKTD